MKTCPTLSASLAEPRAFLLRQSVGSNTNNTITLLSVWQTLCRTSVWMVSVNCRLANKSLFGMEVSINPGHGESVSGHFRQLLCRRHFSLSRGNQPVDTLLQNPNLPNARAFATPASTKVSFSSDSQLLLSVGTVHKGDPVFVQRRSTIQKLDNGSNWIPSCWSRSTGHETNW